MAKEEGEGKKAKEGASLLGRPTFKRLENGRLKCVETGHELPAHSKKSYAQSKHCRTGLIDAALARNKPPLNMFTQDPASRSKLICNLTGVTINKSEEHIWKHITGKRFLNKLEQKEAEKLSSNGSVEEEQQMSVAKKADDLKKNKKKKKKKKKVKGKGGNAGEAITGKDSDSEEAVFWKPPVGDGDGGDGSNSGPETELFNGTDSPTGGSKDAVELSKRTKRMSIDIGPSNFASRKKKKKTTHSSS